MTKKEIKNTIDDIVNRNCIIIGVDSIHDLQEITDELNKLGYKCSFEFCCNNAHTVFVNYKKK